MRGRVVLTQGEVTAQADDSKERSTNLLCDPISGGQDQRTCGGRGGHLLSSGPRHRTSPAGQILGAAGGDEIESAVAATGQAG
jgi:hypothetical protein